MKLQFEWSQAKADSNWRRHGVSFRAGTTVFKDPFAIELLDDREDYGEQRFVILGMAEAQTLLFAAYTEREDRIRIISARRTTPDEEQDYFLQNT